MGGRVQQVRGIGRGLALGLALLAWAGPGRAAEADRFGVSLQAAGELFANAGSDEQIRSHIDLDARFDFVQAPPDEAGVTRRIYDKATATIEVDGATSTTTLGADARSVSFALRGLTPVPFLPDAFLSREEAELLETPFDPLLIDRLLPAEPVATGGSWNVAADAVAGLLAIDTVESGNLEATLAASADGMATVTVSGIVEGAVDGVPTHLVVEGSFRVHAETVPGGLRPVGPPEELTMTIQERRQAGHVAPGFEVEVRIAATRRSAIVPTATAPAYAPTRRLGIGRPGLVWHRDEEGRYDLVHDGDWRPVENGAEGLVMRLIDRGALVCQCSITALPRIDARKPPTAEELGADVRRSLGGQAERIEAAAEARRSDGVRVVRVVASGSAEGLPFRWIHYVVTDEAGHRVAATFMLEHSFRERFGDRDRDLIDGLGFPAADPAGQVATGGSGRPSGTP